MRENTSSHTRARDPVSPADFVEYPMLFSAAMVRAILAGAKTQTRRCIMPRNSLVNGSGACMRADPEILSAWPNLDFGQAWIDAGPSPAGNPGPYLKAPGPDDSAHRVYSRIQPGDELWVRETWCAPDPGNVVYRADMSDAARAEEKAIRRVVSGCVPWRPSIFMPRWASRITLKITSVRAERLQDISALAVRAEGVESQRDITSYVPLFHELWDSINGKRAGCSWADNPWVWVLSFKRIAP
jgi:hypothetical protein